MEKRVNFLTKGLIIALMAVFGSTQANAEVIWNLKVGAMPKRMWESSSDKEYGGDKKTLWDFSAGLELDIPFNPTWGLTTGLRYKWKHTKMVYDYSQSEDYYWQVPEPDEFSIDGSDHLELPLRLTWNKKLKKKMSVQVSAGPFVAYGFSNDEWYVGIEPSVSLYLWNFNIGLTYNSPVFKNSAFGQWGSFRTKHEYMSGLMVTMGIRFNSSVWGSIGKGLVVFDEVMRESGMYDTLNSYAASNGSASSSYSSSYSDSSSYNSSSSSRSTDSSSGHSMSEMNSRNSAERAYRNDESLLSKMVYGSSSVDMREVRKIQKRMSNTRKKWEARGLGWSISPMETWSK